MKDIARNAHFIADAHDPRITLDAIRERWRAGDYGKPRTEFAQGWLKMAGRITKGQDDD